MMVTFALPDDDGHPVETCTIGTDVTERKRARGRAPATRLDWERASGRRSTRGGCSPTRSRSSTSRRARRSPASCSSACVEDSARSCSPASFLPAAERFGLIQTIDVWMVRQAIELAATRAPEVNLSAISMCDPDVRREIVGLLSQAPEAARRIVLRDHRDGGGRAPRRGAHVRRRGHRAGLRARARRLRHGLRLVHLPARPAAALPEDRPQLRARAVARTATGTIVQSIVGVARQFGLQTIAEGVEDAGDARAPARRGRGLCARIPPRPAGRRPSSARSTLEVW